MRRFYNDENEILSRRWRVCSGKQASPVTTHRSPGTSLNIIYIWEETVK